MQSLTSLTPLSFRFLTFLNTICLIGGYKDSVACEARNTVPDRGMPLTFFIITYKYYLPIWLHIVDAQMNSSLHMLWAELGLPPTPKTHRLKS